jgi:hypothetical protein
MLSKRSLLGILALTCAVCAQNAPPPVIPDRMVFRVIANSKIDTSRAKAGDSVRMIVAAPETLDDGTVIKAGTRLEGHVVESIPYSSSNLEARLSIRIDRLQFGRKWILVDAFIIAQGQIRTTRITDGVKSPCFDPFSKRSPAQDINCDENQRTAPLPGLKTSSSSPVMHDVELLQTGMPPNASTLISHKGNIVVEQNMAFLIRSVITR